MTLEQDVVSKINGCAAIQHARHADRLAAAVKDLDTSNAGRFFKSRELLLLCPFVLSFDLVGVLCVGALCHAWLRSPGISLHDPLACFYLLHLLELSQPLLLKHVPIVAYGCMRMRDECI